MVAIINIEFPFGEHRVAFANVHHLDGMTAFFRSSHQALGGIQVSVRREDENVHARWMRGISVEI